MNHRFAVAVIAAALLSVSPAAGAASPEAERVAAMRAEFDQPQRPLVVSTVWARATPPGVPVGAAYFTIQNNTARPDALLAVSSPVAQRAELHRTVVQDNIARMRPVGELAIGPGETIKAEPGGLHLMLNGLRQPLVAGTRVPLTLQFRNAGKVTVQVEVKAATEMVPAAEMHGGQAGHPH